MPFFHPHHYRASAKRFKPRSINALLHYSFVGRYEGYATSPYFDTAYYLKHNRDVAYSGADPLLHFTRSGWREGRCPSPMVNQDSFFRAVRKKTDSGLGLSSDVDPDSVFNAESYIRQMITTPATPSDADWEALPIPEKQKPIQVDVIVPVYAGMAETLRCLYHVLRFHQETAFELVIINDNSPDVQLVQALRRLAARGYFNYLDNEVNLGFVKSVNRGIQLHGDRDVVLLNADTEPYNNWLDRLRACAYREARVASVTPLSNSATICSYPVFKQDNPYPLELPGEEIDRLASDVNCGQSVSSPTAVGFCMYLPRAAIAEIGFFDEVAFQRGYGEENDFSQRALKAGWKNLIASDVYVWHWSSTSFKGSKATRMIRAMRLLENSYPNYRSDVAAFIASDPLRPSRRRLDEARLGRFVAARNVLLATHQRGGGVQRFVSGQAERWRQAGRGVFFLTPSGDKKHACISALGVNYFPNLELIDFQEVHRLEATLKRCAITELEIHHLSDLDGSAPGSMIQCAHSLGIRLEIFVHDYHAICPRINLIGPKRVYCEEPTEKDCERCLGQRVKGLPNALSKNIREWRQRYGRLYEGADQVNVPDEDVATRLLRYFDISTIAVRPHEPRTSLPSMQLRLIKPNANLRVAIIGMISVAKGFNVLYDCATDAKRRGLPLHFSLMGFSQNDKALKRAGVAITGKYSDANAADTLASLHPHLAWLPSVWPETYSYTLSLTLSNGYPVAAFDIGAIPARLRRAGRYEMIMPLQWSLLPGRINDEFMRFRSKLISPL